jgi:hypothetical protein
MPCDGAVVLSDILDAALGVACEPCARRGRYSVARLIEKHGDAPLTDLLAEIADCQKAKAQGVHDRCKARFEPFRLR